MRFALSGMSELYFKSTPRFMADLIRFLRAFSSISITFLCLQPPQTQRLIKILGNEKDVGAVLSLIPLLRLW